MRYHRLPEDFYEIIKCREMKLDEVAFAVYLRGKSCRFGNPFTCYDDFILKELNTTYKIISKIRKRLQTKGVIKFNSCGRHKPVLYTMLDTYMVPKPHQNVYQTGKICLPKGQQIELGFVYQKVNVINKIRIEDKKRKLSTDNPFKNTAQDLVRKYLNENA